MAIVRAQLPKGGEAVMEEIAARRMRRETYRIHEVRRDAVATLEKDIERAIKRATRGRWDMEAHQAAQPEIRRAIRRFERSLNEHAMRTAHVAATNAIKDYRTAFARLGELATKGPVRAPKVDAERVLKAIRPRLLARTQHVGAWSARELQRVAGGRSLLEGRKTGADRRPSKELARAMSKEIAARAASLSSRVIATEMTAAASAAAAETSRLLAPFMPMRQRWDATIDARTCVHCRNLDGVVTELGDLFPGGLREPPAHPFCRCTLTPMPVSWARAAAAAPTVPVGADLARAVGAL